MSEDERFLAVLIADIFMIQDSNSHPVFRLDLASQNNEVGLETIGRSGGRFLETKECDDNLQGAESIPSLAASSITPAPPTR